MLKVRTYVIDLHQKYVRYTEEISTAKSILKCHKEHFIQEAFSKEYKYKDFYI